jgi:hypothetical protein
MDMDDAERQFRYWQKHPPVHELMAAWVGFKPADDRHLLPRDDPSVVKGNSIMAGIERARGKALPVVSSESPLPSAFPDGNIRM